VSIDEIERVERCLVRNAGKAAGDATLALSLVGEDCTMHCTTIHSLYTALLYTHYTLHCYTLTIHCTTGEDYTLDVEMTSTQERDATALGFELFLSELAQGKDRYVDDTGIVRQRKQILFTMARYNLLIADPLYDG
jgi:hypothetical protein